MDRRAFGRMAGATLLAAAGVARAQQPGRIFQVGYLAYGIPLAQMHEDSATRIDQVAQFVGGMRALGWVEGRSVRYAWRSAEEHDRRSELAADLVRLGVDVIVAPGSNAVVAARVTKTTPIVMANTYRPVELGLARSFARPGGNVTGVATPDPNETVGKRLELLKLIAPHVTRVALVTPARGASADGHSNFPQILERPQLAQPAKALKLQLSFMPYGDPSTLPELMRSAVRQGAQAMNFDDDPALHMREVQEMIAAEARRLRVPVEMPILPAPDNGVLMAYGFSHAAGMRRVPHYVDRILRGEKPEAIPIEMPAKLELHINRAAARVIGLEIPRAVLLQADRVI